MSFTESLDSLVESNPNGLLGAHPSWGRVPLREVCSILNGFPFESKLFSQAGGMPLIRIRDVGRDRTDTCFTGSYDSGYLVQKGDLLVGMDGDFRCDVWKGGAALLNQRVCKLVVDSGRYSPRFLRYVLQGYLDAIHTKTSSVTVKHLSSRTIGEIPLPLPSRSEQDAISDTLDELLSDLQAGVECLVQAQTKLKAYRASVLKAAVEGRLVPTEAELAKAEGRSYEPADKLLERILVERRRAWEERQLADMKAKGKVPKDDKWKAKYEEPVAPDTSALPALPEGWCWSSVGEAFEVTVGATPSRAVPRYWGGDIPWVSSGEVAFCRITKTREKITAEGMANSSTKLNPAGSVLIGMIGEGKTRGQVAILDIDACANQNAACIQVSRTEVPPEYIYYLLEGQYQATRRLGSGNNQPALNKSRVEAMTFPLPPLAEQRRIVERIQFDFSHIDQISTSITADIARCARLRQAILKAAFEGRLVDQDPNDEPASELLARLIATPEPAPKTKRGRPPKKTA